MKYKFEELTRLVEEAILQVETQRWAWISYPRLCLDEVNSAHREILTQIPLANPGTDPWRPVRAESQLESRVSMLNALVLAANEMDWSQKRGSDNFTKEFLSHLLVSLREVLKEIQR